MNSVNRTIQWADMSVCCPNFESSKLQSLRMDIVNFHVGQGKSTNPSVLIFSFQFEVLWSTLPTEGDPIEGTDLNLLLWKAHLNRDTTPIIVRNRLVRVMTQTSGSNMKLPWLFSIGKITTEVRIRCRFQFHKHNAHRLV